MRKTMIRKPPDFESKRLLQEVDVDLTRVPYLPQGVFDLLYLPLLVQEGGPNNLRFEIIKEF